MKNGIRVLLLLSGLVSFASYCDTPNATWGNSFHLDRSQDVYFEKFSPYLFSEKLLEAKDNFNTRNVIIGGLGEFDAQTWNSQHFPGYENGSGIYATQLIADGMSNLTDWLTVLVSPSEFNVGQSNGNVFQWQRAFLLFGNLDASPFYVTAGVNTIPFGVFSGAGAWDTPLTGNYFNLSQAPQVIGGWHFNGINVMTGWYSDEVNNNNHGVASVYYSGSAGDFSYEVGTGFVTNVNSDETQDSNRFSGAIRQINTANIGNFGNVIDVNGSLSYGNGTLMTEFDQGSLDVNHNTGKPAAYSVIGNYQMVVFQKVTTAGLGFSRTYHLKDVVTFLAGQGGVSPIISGLERAWSFTLSRTISPTLTLGFDYQRAKSYRNNNDNTNAYTLDLTTYL